MCEKVDSLIRQTHSARCTIFPTKIVRTYLFIAFIGFNHTSFVFAQEANMHENKYNSYKVPSGLLILFLEKALTLVHMETHLDDVSDPKISKMTSTTGCSEAWRA